MHGWHCPTGTRSACDEIVELVGTGVDVISTQVDVADRAAVAAWATEVVEHLGGVNMIVNNAGVSVTGDFLEMTYEDFDWIVGINFVGVVNGTKEFLPHLIASGDGYLVNISSLFGLISMPGNSAYNATKYAVRGLTEAIREEMLVAKHPVGVTCVHPGGIKTGIARHGRKTASLDATALDRLFEEKLARMTPEKQPGSSSTVPLRTSRGCSSASTLTSSTSSAVSSGRAIRTSSPRRRSGSCRCRRPEASRRVPLVQRLGDAVVDLDGRPGCRRRRRHGSR